MRVVTTRSAKLSPRRRCVRARPDAASALGQCSWASATPTPSTPGLSSARFLDRTWIARLNSSRPTLIPFTLPLIATSTPCSFLKTCRSSPAFALDYAQPSTLPRRALPSAVIDSHARPHISPLRAGIQLSTSSSRPRPPFSPSSTYPREAAFESSGVLFLPWFLLYRKRP
ncbi:hypothetical protein BU26DRAFT_306189 [Trematosphaeria pertusa]|uniref:Uncharacterized protein n=1 Tax=Trematosphaeria pertusa TaxID=390896 RepID=A0A6A6IFW7_9PLEO|nr:uncharacterized protein BU26DRAFT_306189 [Trematosphaeria pertusa]KAF2248802.1 hypothetical protein BU26DRAFT_306189 [Trematosphaeria pertusa]